MNASEACLQRPLRSMDDSVALRPDGILCGAVAKHPSGRDRIVDILHGTAPLALTGGHGTWWCDHEAGVALYAPTFTGKSGVLSIQGALYGQQAGAGLPSSLKKLLEDLDQSVITALDRLRGAFCLAFWDQSKRQLVLARDHFGQRSLFIAENADLLLFSSEMEWLLAAVDHAPRLDIESACHFLTFGRPAPGRTLAAGIRSLPAAHLLVITQGNAPLLHRYFTSLRHDAPKVLDAEGRRDIVALLDTAIEARVPAETSALLLSGGVDSSYLASTVATRHGPDRLCAYTVEFAAPYPSNEVHYARHVANASGIQLHVEPLTPQGALTHLEKVLTAPQPCSSWTAITHRHLLQRVHADGHRSLLSGLGSDEIFGGYDKYLRFYADFRELEAQADLRGADLIDRILMSAAMTKKMMFHGIARFFTDGTVRAGSGPVFQRWSYAQYLSRFYRECLQLKSRAHFYELMIAHECEHRIPDLLFTSFEPASRELGIATAYPFLDPALVGRICGLGAAERHWLVNDRWRNKKLMREMASRRIPSEILERSNGHYTAPFWLWMKDRAFSDRIRASLFESSFWDTGLLDRNWVQNLERKVAASGLPPSRDELFSAEQLWVVAVLASWHDRWIKHR